MLADQEFGVLRAPRKTDLACPLGWIWQTQTEFLAALFLVRS